MGCPTEVNVNIWYKPTSPNIRVHIDHVKPYFGDIPEIWNGFEDHQNEQALTQDDPDEQALEHHDQDDQVLTQDDQDDQALEHDYQDDQALGHDDQALEHDDQDGLTSPTSRQSRGSSPWT